MLKIYAARHIAPRVLDSQNDWIQTICVGGLKVDGCLTDDTGNNIADMNPFFSELTAHYWVRHNKPSDYVGFFQYRRWLSFIPLEDGRSPEVHATEAETFDFVNAQRQRDFCLEILQTYDIILPRRYFFPFGIRRQFLDGPEMDLVMWDALLEAIKVLQPKYYKMLNYLNISQYAYMRCMYVTSWELFCAYFDELYVILMYVFNRHSERYKNKPIERRFCAYLSERYMTLWLHCNRSRIREATLINISDYGGIVSV